MRNDGTITIGTKLDTKSFDQEISLLERKLNTFEKAYEKSLNPPKGKEVSKERLEYLQLQIEKTSNKLLDLRRKQEDLNDPSTTNWTEGFGEGLRKNIKSISKMILGIFSIRSAYLAVRSAMNTIAENDAQLKADIDYIKGALAMALEPVIRRIVELAKNLLYFIGAVIKVMTGVNIFENANKSLKGANKQAKALKKQLAGFDEMNVLSDTSGGGGTGDVGPSFDLSNLDSWVAKVEEMKNKWFEFGEEMRTSLFDMPFEVWTKAFGDWDLAVYGVTEMVYGLWEVVTGFVEFFVGIAQMIYGLITGDTDLINKGFQNLMDGLEKMVLGFGDFLKGMMDTINGIIKGVGMFFVHIIADTISDAINKFNGFKDKVVGGWSFIRDKAKSFITDIQTWLTEKFGVVGTTIGNAIAGSISGIVNTILGFAERTINGFFGTINGAIGVINKIPGVNIKKLTTVSFPRLAKGGIVNMPGRGVPIGGAIAGERGAEGVIPLTDSQQMALLGEAIGKYININATVPVYVGNRQIAREIKKIEAENDFAYNG